MGQGSVRPGNREYCRVRLSEFYSKKCSAKKYYTKKKDPKPSNDASISPVELDSIELGRAVYNYRCYFCHGYSGDARTLAASFMTPPPRSFIDTAPADLSLSAIEKALREGRPGTAMKSFQQLLSDEEISNVALFVREAFMVKKQKNTKYHTEVNGWINHDKYRDAFPFALGEVPIDTPWSELSDRQKKGKTLFMGACVSCHDRAVVEKDGEPWQSRPLSFPRNGYSHRGKSSAVNPDAVSMASPMGLHDEAARENGSNLTADEKQGRELFLENCAFCHGADGKGKNWIGSFIEPHPRDLSDKKFLSDNSVENLIEKISNGVPGSAMPAWKSVLNAKEIRSIARYIKIKFITK